MDLRVKIVASHSMVSKKQSLNLKKTKKYLLKSLKIPRFCRTIQPAIETQMLKSSNGKNITTNQTDKSKFDEFYQMNMIQITQDLLNSEKSNNVPPEAREQISADKWIHKYGLVNNKLSWDFILKKIGFKKSEEYVYSLKKPVCSRYSIDLFVEVFSSIDGRTYNVTRDKKKMLYLFNKLKKIQELYQKRIEWLYSSSRRVFGLIVENFVIIVFDVKTQSYEKFNLYKAVATDIIRTKPIVFSKEIVQSNQTNIEKAIKWIENKNSLSERNVEYTVTALELAANEKV
ncbi:von Willebrand factor A domain-containing protein 3B-like [Octopus sinensis]|uniref:von Willebrand factor A domain-containing protein 3B-like n=1 Tax=Octopus sinensis TaxID=2607531 RepID=A0A6P7U0K7_9MOLL|nr:von Willebrand factor A domain-containing protein 3B-like [Octopus sinensis]